MAEYPPTLPPNTMLARLGINAGPAEAVPFNVALALLLSGSAGTFIATQAEAEAGTDNTKVMTPLRVVQSILFQLATSNARVLIGLGVEFDDYNLRRVRNLARQSARFTFT